MATPRELVESIRVQAAKLEDAPVQALELVAESLRQIDELLDEVVTFIEDEDWKEEER